MKKVLLSVGTLFTLSYGLSINEIVDKTLSNNYDLKSLERSIDISKQEIKIVKNWENPILTIGANDIWLNEPLKRDNEAMQAQFIGITQMIPINNKLEILEKVSKKDQEINKLFFEDKKLQLKSKIYEYIYSILIIEEKLKFLNEYQNNTKRTEQFLTNIYKYNNSVQNEILNTKVSFENLNLKKQRLKNSLNNLYLKLEEISYLKIDSIDEKINVKKIEFSKDITTHPKIKILIKNASKYEDISEFEEAKKYSDIKLNVLYFQRDRKFNDYANISLSIPLSFNNTEKTKSLIAKNKSIQKKDELQSLIKRFQTQVNILQNNLNLSYENYILIENSIVPIKESFQKNIENYNSFERINPQEMIKNLNEIISLKLSSLDELQKYYENYAQLIYYTQKVPNE